MIKRLTQAAALLIGLSVLLLRPAYPESIPLKLEGGTYVVPVVINGKITLDFTLDSGASDVVIPEDVYGTLLAPGPFPTPIYWSLTKSNWPMAPHVANRGFVFGR